MPSEWQALLDSATGGFVAAGSKALHIGVSLCLGAAGSYKGCAMSIQGEVRVRKMHWLPLASFNEGRYVIRPFECSVIGKDEGYAPVKASIHVHLSTFDEEEWRIITLFVAHLDSSFKHTLQCSGGLLCRYRG